MVEWTSVFIIGFTYDSCNSDDGYFQPLSGISHHHSPINLYLQSGQDSNLSFLITERDHYRYELLPIPPPDYFVSKNNTTNIQQIFGLIKFVINILVGENVEKWEKVGEGGGQHNPSSKNVLFFNLNSFMSGFIVKSFSLYYNNKFPIFKNMPYCHATP